jgi:hypothetical protein
MTAAIFSRLAGDFRIFMAMDAKQADRRARSRKTVCLGIALAALVWPVAGAEPRGFRRLAPGTLTVIRPDREADHTMQRAALREITVARADMAWQPRRSPTTATMVEVAKNCEFKFDVWCLEFAFKPPRRIDVDVPVIDQASGQIKMRVTPCWYLIYRVKNIGWQRTVIAGEGSAPRSVEAFEKPVGFMPHFVLESREGLAADEGPTAYRGYLDRLVPPAMEAIRQREDPSRRFYDSVSIAERELAPGEERWGIAVWENIDPRIDFFTIYVQGLTNAVRWRPAAGPRVDSDDTLESLRLDFWRPGDGGDATEDEMSIGYVGIFERMAIGAAVNEALDRAALTKADPLGGLAALKLTARDLGEPTDDQPGRFAPLVKVLTALAKLPAGPQRNAAARELLGDAGFVSLDDALRAGDPLAEGKPLEFLAALVKETAKLPPADRKRRLAEVLGPAAPQIDRLVGEVAIARRIAVLDAAGMTRQEERSTGPLATFDAFDAAVKRVGEPADRDRFLASLFGPRGPALYAGATAVHEGIDHAWVFRYEIDDSPGENRR